MISKSLLKTLKRKKVKTPTCKCEKHTGLESLRPEFFSLPTTILMSSGGPDTSLGLRLSAHRMGSTMVATPRLAERRDREQGLSHWFWGKHDTVF